MNSIEKYLEEPDSLLTLCIEKDGEGYHGYCRQMKGLHIGGETLIETITNLRDASLLYLKSLDEHGD